MKLLIVSTAPLIYKAEDAYAYGPYVSELLILNKFSDEIIFCCPVWENDNGLLISKVPFEFTKHFKLIDSNVKSLKNIFKSVFQSFFNLVVIFKAMNKADHIHLRCPGNIGLLGSFVQIFFPGKKKTAKYAGNWDPKSQQPWTYRLQKYILKNTFLTRNMQVLVYGDWKNMTSNIKPFFTATYSETEKALVQKADFNPVVEFVFVGSLVSGKNPMYAVKLVEKLIKSGNNAVLNLYGDGIERAFLQNYIDENKLNKNIFLNGNQNQEIIKKAYQKSHFVILPSKSEGWPKAIAEGMFWGCVPIATQVSCIPFMLDYGKRGILIDMDLDNDLIQIQNAFIDKNKFFEKSALALQWSRNYTTDVFETEIEKLLTQ
jgi:glycosyltransferase involved in cell wall biosynthesis